MNTVRLKNNNNKILLYLSDLSDLRSCKWGECVSLLLTYINEESRDFYKIFVLGLIS